MILKYFICRTGEYCYDEVFEATCDKGETVEVTFAKYGRMSHGRYKSYPLIN